jgi:hypothetical protein
MGLNKDEVIQEIDSLDVYGVGESDALDKQNESHKRDEKLSMQRRQVNKRKL